MENLYNALMPRLPLDTNFAQLCKEIRLKLELSQKDMAQRLNVNFRTYQSWEYGKNEPTGRAALILNKLKDELFQAGGEETISNVELSYTTSDGITVKISLKSKEISAIQRAIDELRLSLRIENLSIQNK